MILTDSLLLQIDEALFLAEINHSTLKELDDLMSDFGFESVFHSDNKVLIAKAKSGRLIYYCDYKDSNNELSSCMLVVSYKLSINKTNDIKDSLSNVLLDDISFSLLQLFTEEADFIEEATDYILTLDQDIQEQLRTHKNLSEEERKKLLQNYSDNGF